MLRNLTVIKSILCILFSIVFLSFCFAPLCLAEDDGVTVSEPNLFSYQAPKGWTLKSLPSATYKAACDIKGDNIGAVITVEMDKKAGSLQDYSQQSLANNKKLFAEAKIEIGTPQPFDTISGIKGIRVPIALSANGNSIPFIDYFFEGKSDAKLTVSCSCPVADKDRYASIFDAAMKTFTLQ